MSLDYWLTYDHDEEGEYDKKILYYGTYNDAYINYMETYEYDKEGNILESTGLNQMGNLTGFTHMSTTKKGT